MTHAVVGAHPWRPTTSSRPAAAPVVISRALRAYLTGDAAADIDLASSVQEARDALQQALTLTEGLPVASTMAQARSLIRNVDRQLASIGVRADRVRPVVDTAALLVVAAADPEELVVDADEPATAQAAR